MTMAEEGANQNVLEIKNLRPIDIYRRTLKVVRFFLDNMSENVTIAELQDLDPTIEQVADDVKLLATILRAVADDSFEDEDMAINAFQCAIHLSRLADVVRSNQEDQLEQLIKDLEMHCDVPQSY